MRILRVLLILALSCASLSAQTPPPTTQEATAQPAKENSAGTATFYFYRLRKFYANALKPSIFSDKAQILRMRNGRFVQLQLPAGEHTITSNFPGNGLVIDAKAGETYYIRMEMTQPAFMHTSKGEITQVQPGQGKFEVSQLKPGEPDDTKLDAHPEKD